MINKFKELMMEDDLIEYFLKWELEWLIPCKYEDKVKEIKKQLNLS